LDFKLDICTYF